MIDCVSLNDIQRLGFYVKYRNPTLVNESPDLLMCASKHSIPYLCIIIIRFPPIRMQCLLSFMLVQRLSPFLAFDDVTPSCVVTPQLSIYILEACLCNVHAAAVLCVYYS